MPNKKRRHLRTEFMVAHFKAIAFTFKHLSFEQVGLLHKAEDQVGLHFTQFLKAFQLQELMYLSTCNRVEFFLVSEREIDHEFLHWFVHAIKPELTKVAIADYVHAAEVFEGVEAVKHLMRLSASLESMVVGEREIITQVRQAFEVSKQAGLVGDTIRLIMRQNIEAAKQVFNDTSVALHPVSVVSLAVRALKDRMEGVDQPNISMIGAGKTMQSFANYLHKEIRANYFVFNRTKEKAAQIAQQLNGKAYDLSALSAFSEPITFIIACTGSSEEILNAELISQLNAHKKLQLAIDLAIPADINKLAIHNEGADYIGLTELESIAKNNLEHRQTAIIEAEDLIQQHLEIFEALYKERQVEKAFSDIPNQIKLAKEKAINEVFSQDIATLDDNAKNILLKAMNYLEKKANAAVMTAAKSELL
jgi:glutamyl-tRNA reductase